MSPQRPCAVCAATVPALYFRRRHRRGSSEPWEAFLTFRSGDRVGLAQSAVVDVQWLCAAHHAVWESSPLARAWLAATSDTYAMGFTAEQFGRFARAHGMSARVLKKRLVRDAAARARGERRARGRHGWATDRARADLLAQNPWAQAAVWASVGAYAIMDFFRRAA